MSCRVTALDRSDAAPLVMSDRFRTEIAYFMSLPGAPGVPKLGPHEYWVDAAEAKKWLEEGVFHLVSPLDSQSQAEVELSEEHETWLEWMLAIGAQHVRVE
jgi:hypothetical protein